MKRLIYPEKFNITREQVQYFYDNGQVYHSHRIEPLTHHHVETRTVIAMLKLTVMLRTIMGSTEYWKDGIKTAWTDTNAEKNFKSNVSI